VSLFLDALSDAAGQMTETLASVSQAFRASWGRGLEALLDRPAALFYLAAFAAAVVFIMGGLRGGRAGYQRGRFLTTNEKSFLMTLDAALGRNYRAFAQVRLAELVSPTLGANPASRRQALNGVMAKSVDFVICDVLTLDPVAAIEVDDKSHLLPERQQRDAFVNAVFLEVGLPLMRVKARRAYSVDELRVMCARAGLFTLPPRMEGANS
jgi:very-short-patch-repair endonuclease